MIARWRFWRTWAALCAAVTVSVSVCAAAYAAPADQWRAKVHGYEGDPNVQGPNPDRCRSVARTKWLLLLTGFQRPGRPSVHSPR